MAEIPHPRTVAFGLFEFDPGSCELRRRGVRVRLAPHLGAVLQALLESPGEIVTRERLQRRLWPEQAFLELDNGLNNAVGRLRQVLGDRAAKPAYIETIPRRGYRFVHGVRADGAAAAPAAAKRGTAPGYLVGRRFLREDAWGELAGRREELLQAVRVDPTRADAYDGLAHGCALLHPLPGKAALSEAREYAQTALRLDATLPASHAALAQVHYLLDWDWPAAEREFGRAIALAPDFLPGRIGFAHFLCSLGRHQAALEQAGRALDLDAHALDAHHAAARAGFEGADYDRTRAAAQAMLDRAPADLRGHMFLALACLAAGDRAGARRIAESCLGMLRLSPVFLYLAANIFGHLGDAQSAREARRHARERGFEAHMPPIARAGTCLALGEVEEAFAILEHGYAEHDCGMVSLASAPWLRPRRSHPRFTALLRQMNLPAPEAAAIAAAASGSAPGW